MFTEFINNPKNSISVTGISCDFVKFITKPKFCNRKINVSFACKISFNVWAITSMLSKNIIILTMILLNKATGIIGSSVKIRGLDPGQNISKWICINFLPIENEYIFFSFCLEVCQNRHLLDPSLSKSRVFGEDLLLNASLSFWNDGMVRSCSEIWDLLQVDDLQPFCLLWTNCSEILQVLIISPSWIAPFLKISFISEFTCNLSSWFTLANWGGPYWNGVWEKGILKPFKMDKIFASWVFPNFLNKMLVLLPVEPVSLWHGKGFWPKDVLLTCLHPEVVDCWGKVMLLFLPWCLCFCGIVLTKNACGTGLPTPLPFDDAGGHPSKGRVIPAECCLCWFGLFTQKFLVFLLGCKVSAPILSEVLPKLLFMALREDASFLF